MDEQQEMDSLQEKCLRLCEYWAYLREIPMPARMYEDDTKEEFTSEGLRYVSRAAFQFEQALTFSGFITKTADSYFQLLREPEQAEEIGREGLQRLHAFLEEYTRLLAEEYSWYQ